MKYALRHVTTYAYESQVDLASHLLHLSPRAMPGQTVLTQAITTDPAPDRIAIGIDHFGNDVRWLFLETPHQRFSVSARAVVEVDRSPPPDAAVTPLATSLAALASGAAATNVAEFLFDSPLAPTDSTVADFAVRFFPPGTTTLAGALAMMHAIHQEFAFRAGVTSVATTVAQILKLRAGVCQDFSHLMVASLRVAGVPARYVSGYIRTRPPPGAPRRLGADQSHAWVAAWLGPDLGWVELDPTNGLIVKDEHVVLGWGRDFADVSPLRGFILGGGRHRLTVGVDLDPMTDAA